MATRRSPLTQRNSRTTTGQFNSIRDDGELRAFKNRPEFLHLTILDVDPDVASFSTQLEALELGPSLSFTPDVLVTFGSERPPAYRVVTWLSRVAKDPELGGRRGFIETECRRRGADFEIVTETYWSDAIRVELATSMRHAVRRASRLEMDMVTSALEGGALSLAELARQTGLAQQARFAALSLCARGKASLSRDRRVGQTTLFWLS